MAGGDRVDWQLQKSVIECNRHMFDMQIATDINFCVGSTDDTAETISAHKYVLISRSPVFFAMLCGQLPETDKTIRITDVEAEAFRHVLRYLYCDEVEVSSDSVLPTLYAAKKYMIPALVERCVHYLEDSLSPQSVCLIYEQSLFYDEHLLTSKCVSFIETRTEDILKNSSFMEISQPTLMKILRFDKLTVTELQLFTACLEWAKVHCKKNSKEQTGVNMRAALGEALFYIRFPTMTLRDFANNVSRKGILTAAEKCAIFEYLTCDETDLQTQSQMKFPVKYRQRPQPSILKRFTSFSKTSVYSGDCSIMKLQCDKSILVKGFGVSSSVGFDPLAEVQITIKQDRNILCNKSVVVNDERTGDMIHIVLAEGVIVRPSTWYTLIITFHFYGEHDQGSCKRGKGGYKSITCDGVSFDFDRADAAGFVPEILFCRV